MTAPDRPEDLDHILGLLARARESLGDSLALSRLASELRAMASRRLSPDDRLRRAMDSHDLGQDVFIELVTAADAFRGETWLEFWSFVQRVMDRRIAELARHHGAQKRELDRAVDLAATLERAISDPGPPTNVAHAEDINRVRALVTDLPEPYRTAMLMRLDGNDYTTIAATQETGEPTARKRVSRALNLLQERWRDGESGPS